MNGGDCTEPLCTRDKWQSLGDMGPFLQLRPLDLMLGTEVLGDSMGGLGRLCNLPGEEPRKKGGSPKLGVQGRKEWRTLRGKGNSLPGSRCSGVLISIFRLWCPAEPS